MDPIWLLIALLFGMTAQAVRLPPLVGFLVAGFALHALGEEGGFFVEAAAEVGVLLLLFTIGLKLRPKSFLAPAVWGGASLHMLLSTLLATAVLGLAAMFSLADINWTAALIVAFGLSFSSTVLAVKIFEERSEMRARHAFLAVGILIIQDLLAVGFLIAANESPPTIWAFALLGLPLLRPLLLRVLTMAGHGEMLVLFGLTLAIAGAGLFDVVGVKADLGALVAGALLSNHAKSNELSRALNSFRDFFLIGFFLSIGLIGFPEWSDILLIVLLVAVILPLKTLLYFFILTRFRLRARTAFLTTLSLAAFSEFGLIVVDGALDAGWVDDGWLVMLALTAALSFVIASILNARAHELYRRVEGYICRFESPQPLPQDGLPDIGDAEVLIVGMGRVGRGAYRAMVEADPRVICGVDVDNKNVVRLRKQNYNVVSGDAEDIDFWRHVVSDRLHLVLLALPTHRDRLLAAKWLQTVGYHGKIGAVTKHEDQRAELMAAGVDAAFNYYSEVGAGFAAHVRKELPD